MSTLNDRKAELNRAENDPWTFIVFLKNGRTIMSPKRYRSRLAVARYIGRRSRDLGRMAKPESLVHTGDTILFTRNRGASAVPR